MILAVSEKRIVALPITSNTKETEEWQSVIKKLVKEKDGKLLLDQIRSFDKQRLLRKIGKISSEDMLKVNQLLKKMFCL